MPISSRLQLHAPGHKLGVDLAYRHKNAKEKAWPKSKERNRANEETKTHQISKY
jgi:hypothetical protein